MDDFGRLMTALGLTWNIHRETTTPIEVTVFGDSTRRFLKGPEVWTVTVSGTVFGDLVTKASSLEGAQAAAVRNLLDDAGMA